MPDILPIGATYSRVSNPNDTREASLDSQEAAAVAKLEAEGYHVPLELRFRERWTGMESIYDRPVLGRIRDLAAEGRIRAVGCYDTDRLARDPSELTIVVRGLHQAGTKPLFAQMDHTTQGRIGEMVLYMKGFASAVEWDQLKDRTMRGKMAVHNAGQWIGNGRCKYGYIWNPENRTRSEHPEHSSVVRMIFDMVAAGNLPSFVAEHINGLAIPTPFRKARWVGPTIRFMIRDPTYKGECRARKTVPVPSRRANGTKRVIARPVEEQLVLRDHRTAALVSAELWSRANAALTARARCRPSPKPNPEFLLSGLVWCGKEGCGCRMSPSRENRRGSVTRYYRCGGNQPSRRHRTGCVRNLSAVRLEAEVWDRAVKILLAPGVLERELKKLKPARQQATIANDIRSAEQRRAALDKRIKAMLDARTETDSKLLLSALATSLAEMDKEAAQLDEQLAKARERMVPLKGALDSLADFSSKLASLRAAAQVGTMTDQEKRKILEAIGARIIAWPGGCKLELDVRYKTESNTSITSDLLPLVGTITA
jgi:site-specific DNA recombinase